MISSSLFAGFVPSLSLLGTDLPMSLAIRPAKAPHLTFGKNLGLSDPLLTLDIEDLSVDVYAHLEERLARLFTLTLDISVPLVLELGTNELGQTTVKPVIGAISQMLAFNTEVATNSEILTEDISTLGTQLSSLLSMADGLVGNYLKTYAIPDVYGLRFRVDGVNGLAEGKDADGKTASSYLGAFVSVALAEEAAAE